MPGIENQDLDDPQTLLVEGIIDRTEANEAAEKKRKLTMLEKQYHDELNMELQGITYSTSLSNKNLQSSVENVKEDTVTTLEESEDLSKVSMSRKKRKLYEAMKVFTCSIYIFAYIIYKIVLLMGLVHVIFLENCH
ncbi:hypothetical protein BHE74_00046640 [Ensete ventricosum]|nr:hypothetical protein GW17_00026640 [Ensete ventricosum]RWW47380.1 hypothetical protein BHE74_00046640 [Ensete ventricosum]RZS06360.1 hypothetical protein BHM03_00037006 [Ensete ventricosum]